MACDRLHARYQHLHLHHQEKARQVIERLRHTRVPDVGVSSITLSELEYGAAKSARPEQNKLAIVEFLAPLEILPYDDMAAQEYGKVRVYLENKEPQSAPWTCSSLHTRCR